MSPFAFNTNRIMLARALRALVTAVPALVRMRVLFPAAPHLCPDARKGLCVALAEEHTLTLPGASACRNGTAQPGSVAEAGQVYNVRMCHPQLLHEADVVVEYSMPNIQNIIRSERYPNLTPKLVYMPPLLAPYAIRWSATPHSTGSGAAGDGFGGWYCDPPPSVRRMCGPITSSRPSLHCVGAADRT